MTNHSGRAANEEMMDDLEVSGQDLTQSLKELEYINQRLGGQKVLKDAFRELLKNHMTQAPSRSFKITDIGCGGGDLLAMAQHWFQKQGVAVECEGIDANPNVIAYAEKRHQKPGIRFFTEDITSFDFKKREFDLALLTLFCHHFSDDLLAMFLRQLSEKTQVAIVINDLHRHPLPYYFIKATTSLFSRSGMVKNDAPLSVWRGFKKHEWQAILEKAGITNYSIDWYWPFRHQIIIHPNETASSG